jgi:[ribosomal protein S5]-alanine N-acetyltransferase
VRILRYYASHPGLGIWATHDRATGECLGMHLLNHIQGETDIQVGYVLFQHAWGRGVATEMTRALLNYGFHDLRLPQIVAITDLANVASQRVLTKAGMTRRGERAFAHPAYAAQGPLAWFECNQSEWRDESALG